MSTTHKETYDCDWDYDEEKGTVNNLKKIHKTPLCRLSYLTAFQEAIRRGLPYTFKGKAGVVDLRWNDNIYIVSFTPRARDPKKINSVTLWTKDESSPIFDMLHPKRIDFIAGMKGQRPFMFRPPLLDDPNRKFMFRYRSLVQAKPTKKRTEADIAFKYQHLFNKTMCTILDNLTGRPTWRDTRPVSKSINPVSHRMNNVYALVPRMVKLSTIENGMDIESGYYDWYFGYMEKCRRIKSACFMPSGRYRNECMMDMPRAVWYYPDGDVVPIPTEFN